MHNLFVRIRWLFRLIISTRVNLLIVFLTITLICSDNSQAEQSTSSYLDQARAADKAAATVSPPGSEQFFEARKKSLQSILSAIQVPKSRRTLRERLPSVEEDPRFRENLAAMLESSIKGARSRIFGGFQVSSTDFLDTVAVIGENGFCTGTLIAPQVVLTAGHCVCGGAVISVFIGSDAGDFATGAIIAVAHVLPKTACALTYNNEYIDPGNDFGLIWLTDAVQDDPRSIADSPLVAKAYNVTAVGFGATDTGMLYKKMMADVPIASKNCTGKVRSETDASYYGCATGKELVAAVLGQSGVKKDTCIGDSGGPIFIQGNAGAYLLAGVTSRAVSTPGAARCGDGGNYGLLNAEVLHWMAQNGVQVAVVR